MVMYLSPEWATALTEALNADEGFRQAIRNKVASLVFKVSDVPTGDVIYFVRVNKGDAEVGFGLGPGTPNATFECSYDVMCKLSQGTLDGREAAMRRQLRTDAKLPALMKLMPVLEGRQRIESQLDIAY